MLRILQRFARSPHIVSGRSAPVGVRAFRSAGLVALIAAAAIAFGAAVSSAATFYVQRGSTCTDLGAGTLIKP